MSIGQFQGLIGRISVWYLRQRHLGTLLEAQGLVLDGAADSMLVGMRRSQPYRCTVDAFGDLSKDRKIRLYPSESEASKRFRLAHWRQIVRMRACPYGEMINIQPFFLGPNGATVQPSGDQYLPTIRIYHQSGDPGGGTITTCHTLDPFGAYTIARAVTQWNWNNQPAKWSRWWCVVYLPIGFAASGFTWDAGPKWDSGVLWDGLPKAMLDDLVAGLKEAKAAHSRLSGLIVTTLQPGSSIPGFPGVHPFDPTSTAHTTATGATTWPIGNWGSAVYTSGPYFGNTTRPDWATFYAIHNG